MVEDKLPALSRFGEWERVFLRPEKVDNVTHSLIGLAVGEAAVQLAASDGTEADRLRGRFWWMSTLANNLPDIDVMRRGSGAGYLLEHRGYTHTLAGWLPQAVLLWLGFALYYRRRGGLARPGWLFTLAVLGVATHIAFDFANSYGVHPWWPFSGEWHYGDTLFILEPWLWLSLLPSCFAASRTAVGKTIFLSVFLLGTGLLWWARYVPAALAGLATAWCVVLFFVGERLGPRGRAALGLGALALVIAVFAVYSREARRQIIAASTVPLDDVMLTPLPANPFCWIVITAAHDAGTYTLRRGTFAPFPSLVTAASCPAFRRDRPLAPLVAVDATAPDRRFLWEGELRGSLGELRRLAETDCTFRALLHFARAPYITIRGDETIVADLRYDFSRQPSFAAFRLPATRACPPELPPWGMPRADWLGPDQK